MRETMYHSDAVWQQYGQGPDYCERAAVVLDLIPEWAQWILDVGCGSGDVLRALTAARQHLHAIGCDSSYVACIRAPQPVICAALPTLPFRDKSFDVVVCLEVLEHLDEEQYVAAVREVDRLARYSVVIGVPYRETLQAKYVLCASCLNSSHADGHVRSYSIGDLYNLLPAFQLCKIVLTGIKKKRQSKIGSWLTMRIGGRYYHPKLFCCPYCGSDSFLEQRPNVPPLLGKLTALLCHILTMYARPMPYWIIGLYERRRAY
ncbi:MAG: class I SAM-dependent methyltransferase [Desulfobacterota bacterium]|nr:class I SAM-dependent methyltransferase [Thermodesulfobacteriota bacterium]